MLALQDCAAILVKHGFKIDLDDQEENLAKFTFYFGATKASQTLILFGGGTPTTVRAAFSALDLFCHEGERVDQYLPFRPFLTKI